jgi:penicillin-binding protein 2
MLYCGVGRRLGVDIPSEKPGFLPKSSYYDKIYKKRWNAYTILSNSIGQGEVLMTPLQMANIMCLIANRGYYIQPHFLKSVSGQAAQQLVHLDTIHVPIDSVHFETVIRGMRLAVEAGTGYTAYVPGLDLCGKTGTAQNPHGKPIRFLWALPLGTTPKSPLLSSWKTQDGALPGPPLSPASS